MTGLLIFLLLILSYNYYELYKKQCLFNNIAILKSAQDAFDRLILASSNLDSSYKILIAEEEYIYIILNSYIKNIKNKYFNQELKSDWKTCSLNYRDYFFLHLYLYLKKHEDDLFFDYSEYQIYTVKRDLLHSEFGIAYKKVQLITAYYCYQSKPLLKIDPFLQTCYEREKNYFDNYILQQ